MSLSNDFHVDLLRRVLTEAARDVVFGEYTHLDWSTQGFGMARLYLSDDRDVRLNIWHSALAVPDLTNETGLIHTHPWDFTSRIVAGELRNQRYRWQDSVGGFDLWCAAEITPGPGGHFTDAEGRATQPSGHDSRRFGNLLPVKTMRRSGAVGELEIYGPGSTYSQTADEIHHTEYEDGTITINRRERGGRPDRAFTFWKADRDWISAEPKPATEERECLVTALETALELLS